MNHEKGNFVGWHLIGYSTKVSDYLGSNYKVFQPDDNGCFAKYTLRMLFDYRDGIAESDFIHSLELRVRNAHEWLPYANKTLKKLATEETRGTAPVFKKAGVNLYKNYLATFS